MALVKCCPHPPKITFRVLPLHGGIILASDGKGLGAVVHDGRAVVGHPIILTVLTDSIGILIHVFDVLFQHFNMPVSIWPLLGVLYPHNMEEFVQKSSPNLLHTTRVIGKAVFHLENHLFKISTATYYHSTERWDSVSSSQATLFRPLDNKSMSWRSKRQFLEPQTCALFDEGHGVLHHLPVQGVHLLEGVGDHPVPPLEPGSIQVTTAIYLPLYKGK